MCRLSLLLRLFLMAGAAALCGCSDPYLREGTWHATGVNNDNLRVMVADPTDLKWGASQPGTNGQLVAAAVTRLRAGQVKQLPDDSISKIGSSGSSAATPSPTSPAPGGS
jgi:hypothetical protein